MYFSPCLQCFFLCTNTPSPLWSGVYLSEEHAGTSWEINAIRASGCQILWYLLLMICPPICTLFDQLTGCRSLGFAGNSTIVCFFWKSTGKQYWHLRASLSSVRLVPDEYLGGHWPQSGLGCPFLLRVPTPPVPPPPPMGEQASFN